MSTDAYGIPTYAELRAKYADAYGSSDRFKVVIPNTSQCPTAGWIKNNVSSPRYIWQHETSYPNDNQLPRCGHIFTSSDDYIIPNPTPYTLRHIWSISGYPSGGGSTYYNGFQVQLTASQSGGGSYAKFNLSQEAGYLNNFSISGYNAYFRSVNDGWGATGIRGTATITITAIATNPSYGMYGETKTSSLTYTTQSSPGKVLVVGGSFTFNTSTNKFSFSTFAVQWGNS